MSGAPTFSIIVDCKNPGPRLPATLESVWRQRHAAAELIVIDRGSTDGTRAWLDAQGPRVTALATEASAGRYEALNQAIARTRGDWLQFFEPGDRLVGDMVLSETVNWMKKTDCGVVAGEAATDHGRLHKLPSHPKPIAGDFVPRGATFYRRGLFEENGAFEPAFGPMARYELNLRLWKNRVRFKPLPLRIAACEGDRAFDWPCAREEIRIRHRYYAAWRCWPRDFVSLLRAVTPRRAAPHGKTR